jgi:hypothetical protein
MKPMRPLQSSEIKEAIRIPNKNKNCGVTVTQMFLLISSQHLSAQVVSSSGQVQKHPRATFCGDLLLAVFQFNI